MSGEIVEVRAAGTDDAGAIAAIYNHHVTGTEVTFEEVPLTFAEMAGRIESVRAAGLPWLVATSGTRVVGYAYASPWRPRVGYRFAVEISAYVAPGLEGKGVGSALYARLLPLLQELGIHSVMGGIALPNPGSVALHEKFGLVKVAHFREPGIKFGKWIDVGYWQRLL